MKRLIINLILVMGVAACGSGSEDDDANKETPNKGDLNQITRAYVCETDTNNPLIGCWKVEKCFERFPDFPNLNVYATYSYSYQGSGDFVRRYQEYENSDCNGSPISIVDDTKVFAGTTYFEKMDTLKLLNNGTSANIFKVLEKNNNSSRSSDGYLAYQIQNSRLCLSDGLMQDKGTLFELSFAILDIDQLPGAINYEFCMARDN